MRKNEIYDALQSIENHGKKARLLLIEANEMTNGRISKIDESRKEHEAFLEGIKVLSESLLNNTYQISDKERVKIATGIYVGMVEDNDTLSDGNVKSAVAVQRADRLISKLEGK